MTTTEEPLPAPSLKQLADMYRDSKHRLAELKLAVQDANAEMRAIEDDLATTMLTSEMTSFKQSGNQFIVVEKTKASIPEVERERALAFIEKVGHGGIIKRTIHPSTLSSWFNKELDDAQRAAVENNGITRYTETRVQLRKA